MLNRTRGGAGERITTNTLIRVAVALLLSRSQDLAGTTEEELRRSLGLPDLQTPDLLSRSGRRGAAVRWRGIEHVTLERMLDKTPQADRILIAQLHGEAKHHARWRELTEDEHAAAVDAIRELAGGRADLLAHVAGILEGTGEGQLDEPLARQAAGLCRDAGADPEAIPAGSRSGASAGPMPGGCRSPGACAGGAWQPLERRGARGFADFVKMS